MLQKSDILTSWQALVKALEQDYGLSLYEAPNYAIFNLFQEDTVANYYAKFIKLANRMEGMTSSTFLSCFINGLTKDLQRDVIPWKPQSIPTVASLAKLYEEKNTPVSRSWV